MYFDHPERMGAEAVEQLPKLIAQYPYCAAYRMLYCIALANTHSTLLSQHLPVAACALPDRTKLFMEVNNGEHAWVELMQQLEAMNHDKAEEGAETDSFYLIDQYLSQQHLPNSGSGSAVTELPAEYLDNLAPVPDDDDEDTAADNTQAPDEQNALIDRFLTADQEGELMVPKAEHPASEAPTPEPSLIREKAFLTESLAKLYVKQHKFEQALAIFSQLNLQYSEKSSNFADQIRYLEKVIACQKEMKPAANNVKNQ